MKRSKIKGKWIWGVLSTTLAIIFLFSVKMTAVYAAEGERECNIVIPVSVEMKGNAGNIKSEVFEYALEPADENSSTEAVFSEVEVTQEGITKGSFKEMRYTRPGDYKYTVYQLKGESKDVIYDGSVYEVTVRVVNTQEGGLAAEVWAVKDQSDQKTDEIKFINQYKETTTATTEAINNTIHHTTTNTITKSSIGTSSPKTGDKSNVMLWGGMVCIPSSRQLKKYKILVLPGRISGNIFMPPIVAFHEIPLVLRLQVLSVAGRLYSNLYIL